MCLEGVSVWRALSLFFCDCNCDWNTFTSSHIKNDVIFLSFFLFYFNFMCMCQIGFFFLSLFCHRLKFNLTHPSIQKYTYQKWSATKRGKWKTKTERGKRWWMHSNVTPFLFYTIICVEKNVLLTAFWRFFCLLLDIICGVDLLFVFYFYSLDAVSYDATNPSWNGLQINEKNQHHRWIRPHLTNFFFLIFSTHIQWGFICVCNGFPLWNVLIKLNIRSWFECHNNRFHA